MGDKARKLIVESGTAAINPKAAKTLRSFPCGTRYQLSPRVLDLIWLERLRQQQLFRDGKLSFNCATVGIPTDRKLRVCTEELGEIAEAIDALELISLGRLPARDQGKALKHLRDEITQLAACCVAWLESMEKEKS